MGVLALTLACAPSRQAGTADRLYVFDVGETSTRDVANWSPGVDVGKPWVFVNHCYLICHPKGLLLWDTGFGDALVAQPDGVTLAPGLQIRATKTLVAQMASIGVEPTAITHLALSHFHMDHAGNANLFSAATLYIQQAERDAAFGPAAARFGFRPTDYANLRESAQVLLHGDHDVFGDGSVVILSTPGHTPGHQSLLVRLANTGTLVLSGDLAHFRSNWERRRVPATNFDRAATLQSMTRVEALLAERGARLIVHHDQEQGRALPKAPAFLD